MSELRVVLTWTAVDDLADIADQIECQFNRDQAEQFQIKIRREIDKLKYSRRMGWRVCMMYRGYEIHKKGFLASGIFYMVDRENEEVHVLRVLREEPQDEKPAMRKAVYA